MKIISTFGALRASCKPAAAFSATEDPVLRA